MKWGILATGRIAKKFADTIGAMAQEGQQLAAVASRDRQRAESFAKENHIAAAYGSYEELAADKNVEAVYIATPNHLHFENAKMCLDAGKHVLCEKPFTLVTDEAALLYELAAQKGLFIMEAFWIRFLPALQQMQAWIQQGRIGEIRFARSDYGFTLTPERRARKFDPALGGGALLDIGIYNLGFMNMVMGKNPVSFSGDVHMNEFGTDDFSVLRLQYESGADALVTTSIGTKIARNAMVVGTKGMITLDDFQMAQRVILKSFDGQEEAKDFPFDVNGFEYEVRETARCIEAGMSFSGIYTPQMSLETLRLMEDILESWGVVYP